jgi:hypothetical protein
VSPKIEQPVCDDVGTITLGEDPCPFDPATDGELRSSSGSFPSDAPRGWWIDGAVGDARGGGPGLGREFRHGSAEIPPVAEWRRSDGQFSSSRAEGTDRRSRRRAEHGIRSVRTLGRSPREFLDDFAELGRHAVLRDRCGDRAPRFTHSIAADLRTR